MKQLEIVLREAQKHDSELGGMASVGVNYNPYEGIWIVQTDWSSGIAFISSDEDIDIAVTKLLDLLKKKST